MLNFEYNWGNIYEITETLPKRKCVILALYCAELTKTTKQDQICIDLVQQWLDTSKSVTQDQLYNVGSANAVARAASWAAADSVVWAVDATWAAYYAKKYQSKILPYLDALTKDIPKTPYTDPFEIIVYLQDQLEYPILNNNRLNLWDSQYEYQITGTISEIAKTVGIRNLLNA